MSLASGRLVFVGGLHRSGTTPFARVLGGHPDISALSGTGVHEDEGQHLQTVYPPAKTYGGSGHFAKDERAHLTEKSALVSSGNASALLSAWQQHWDLSKRYLLEKSPPNLVMTRFLQALFPEASFIIVVRHPVTVALSTKKWTRLVSRQPARAATLSALVDHWLTAHEIFFADASHLRRVCIVYYEDLINRPESELGKVQKFLGLDQPIPPAGLAANRSVTYEDKWETLGSGWRPGGWQRRLIARKYADRLPQYGYRLNDLSQHFEPQL